MCNMFGRMRKELDFKKQESNINNIEKLSEDIAMRQTLALRFTLFLVRTIVANANPTFRNNFCSNNGLKGLLAMLSDLTFVEQNLNTELLMFGDTKRLLFDFLLRALAELSVYSEDVKQVWQEMTAVNVIKVMGQKIPQSMYYCLTTITNLADDEQIEKMNEVNTFRGILLDMLKDICRQFDERYVRTNWFTIFEDKSRIFTTLVSYEENDSSGSISKSVSLYTILQSLYKLAINDKQKYELYFDLNCKMYIKSILVTLDNVPQFSTDGRYEQKYLLRYVWNEQILFFLK